MARRGAELGSGKGECYLDLSWYLFPFAPVDFSMIFEKNNF